MRHGLERLSDADARSGFATALSHWLPARRWFAGKARRLADVRVEDVVLLDAHDTRVVIDLIVDVRYTGGGVDRYQVPLAGLPAGAARTTGEADRVATVVGLEWVDGAADPPACRVLADLAVRGGERRTALGGVVRGVPVTGAAPVAGAARRATGEQSNTSVVFGEDAICKLFRRLAPGVNPDVELTRALTQSGFRHVPAQRGSLELVPADGPPTALAVVSDFLSGARDGWSIATDDACAVVIGGGRRPELPPQLTSLGAAVAAAHIALRNALGHRRANTDDVAAWRAEMRRQLHEVLATAGSRRPPVSEIAARADELQAAFDELAVVADAGDVVRIHGDLHLGQVMLDRERGWQLLDFEGEPARALHERRQPGSPLRDVAGMLRSVDYAAAFAQREHPPSGTADGLRRWRRAARKAFLAGYETAAEPAALLPRAAPDRRVVLAAFELHKAVYELGYELANRPDWASIPAEGILEMLNRRQRVGAW